jgi:arabinofuranosyltransferase
MTGTLRPASMTTIRPEERALLQAALLTAFTYVLLANAWHGDDEYITFRVAQNFVEGYGLTFNPGERVQAYTHPLWTLVMSAAYLVTREFFFTATAISWACGIGALLLGFRALGSLPRGALWLACLVSSKAWVDYASSSLEYPLSCLLLAWFYARLLRPDARPGTWRPRTFAVVGFIAALAFLNRGDAILLYLPALLWLAGEAWRARGARGLGAIAVGLSPAAAWLLFATVYYGFPLPNTYYAKVATGIPAWLSYQQGLAYVLNSLNFDPVTLATIALAAVMALRTRRVVHLAGVAGSVLYVLYTISIGGDFMSGRFFSMPFFLSALLVVDLVERVAVVLALAAVLAAYNVTSPLAPVKTRASYDQAWNWHLQNGIKDERGYYHGITNLLFFDPFRTMPDHVWYREGLSFRQGPKRATIQGSIGYFGFMAGPTKYVIDRNALSDPLLARLPVSDRLYFEFYIGHYFRDLPEGYVESCEQGQNLLRDPLLHDYYDRVRNVTRGPLFTRARFRDIWDLNVGRYRRLHELVNAHRRTALSIPAINERFFTDVGERDGRQGVMRSWGREGYLQYGPGTPVRAGRYQVRWYGAIEAAGTGDLGFVEVWADGVVINRRQALGAAYRADNKQIAQIEALLARPADRVEYRFYVREGVRVTLERIEVDGGPVEPRSGGP